MISERESYKLWNISGKESVYKMQAPKPSIQTCDVEKVPTNLQTEQDSSSDASIRMNVKLQECFVLLHRLTEDEIHCSYPSDDLANGISDDVRRKTEELLRKTEEAVDDTDIMDNQQITYRKDGTKRRMRGSSSNKHDVFELYKQKRQGYINRRNKPSHSENSLDWSQEEFKTESDSIKVKKRLKRGRKYERDFEWSPSMSKNTVQSTRKLRRQVRRPVIESDSSTSDEEDVLFNFYMNDFNSDNSSAKPAFENIVPSGYDTYEHVDTSTLNSSHKDATVKQNKNSSQISNANSDSMLGDIVSGIIKDMNQLQKSKKLKTSFTHTVQPPDVLGNVKTKPIQRRRKRFKLSSEDKKLGDNIDAEVAILLIDMIKTVTAQVKQLDTSNKRFSKVCKWCHTPFATNRETEIMCAICCDLGKGKYHRTNSTNKKSLKPVKVKPLKENKLMKKKSNTMSRVLKNLPKSEMRRLMYTEKTDKMSVEKGYNHCKSFNTPRDVDNNTYKASSDCRDNVVSNKISVKIDEQKKRKLNHLTEDVDECHVSKKQKRSGKFPVHLMQNKTDNIANVKESDILMKNINNGLFQIHFPGPHKKQDMQDESQTEKLSRLNVGEVTCNESVASALNTNQFKPLVNDKQHDTYLFPPIPTVIVSNYCNDNNGLNLSHTYFQNEITHKHALKSSMSLQSKGKAKTDSSKTVSNANKLLNVTNTIPYQNSSLPTSNLLPNNTSLTITTIPINNTLNHIMPFTSNTSPVLNSLIPATPNKVTLMPVVSSVISLSNKNLTQPNTVETNSDVFSSNNFINSQNLEIKITHVSSEKTYEKYSSSLNSEPGLGSSKSNDLNIMLQKETEIPELISIQRNSSNSVANSKEHILTNELQEQNLENPIRYGFDTINAELKLSENIVDNGNKLLTSNSSANVENLPKLGLNADELAEEQSFDHSLKQTDKHAENKESAISSAMDVLGAISILAVIDLEKNPHSGLNFRIQMAKNNLTKLASEKNVTPELNDKIASCHHNLQVLNIAQKYLNLYGSFAQVSDFLLKKAKMIQIKKELLSEEANQSSCMFSQSSQSNTLSNNSIDVSRTLEVSLPVTTKLENLSSCKLNLQASAINHIEKLQSQIAAMNNTQVIQYDAIPGGGTIHHFPAEQIAGLAPAVAAPTPVTPRNDCMGGESRETPSRGSGPRTPARPESAASQSEEQSLIQIKKEQLEAANSPSSHCVYSQNTLPQISSQLTILPEIPSLNMAEHPISSTTIQHIPVSNGNHQLFTNQSSLHLQHVEMAPNRTISYNNNQNYSDVLLNIATKHQINPSGPSPEIRQNRQVLLGQQMFLQNGSGMCAKQPVPSVNNNQFVIRPPFSSSNTGGTVLVNNSQVGQNALLTNVSNQQFYTSNQVSQLYYPPSSQINCMPSNISTPEVTATQNQQAEVSPDQMVCAVCKSQATLRCKQCARVAYCNTTCAKAYWHQKHKMECKPLAS